MSETSPIQGRERIAAEAREWLVLLDSGRISEADLQAFRLWQAAPGHAGIFEAERELWHDIGILAVAADRVPRPVARPARRMFLRGGLALAGLAGAAAFAPGLMILARADHSTRTGRQTMVELPDSSLALLNTGTAIRVQYADGRRVLRLLQGEVLFTVRPERRSTFAVYAGDSVSRAAAGEFAVRYENDRVSVMSQSARVRIWAIRGISEPSVLLPLQKLGWADGSIPGIPSAGDPGIDLAWRDGHIIFNATPFDIAVRELGRYLPEKIILRGDRSGQTVNGSFEIADAGDALRAIAHTQGLGVRHIPGIALIIS